MSHRFGTWKPTVPVAQRRAQAERQAKKLAKGGRKLHPLDLQGRAIAYSFWGKGWCKHLENFSDYENRLPRGRSYVRNGSVCHLKVDPGRIEALVMGSSLYEVSVEIAPLPAASWSAIKQKCTGEIGSMLELLQGRFSGRVMSVVTARESGLFPQPGEMRFDCSCPDWASLCKHVAAALYGVGSLLDLQPELLFVLRKVDAGELVGAEPGLPIAEGSSQHQLPDDQLAAIFGIEFDSTFDMAASLAAPAGGFKVTAKSVAALRKKLGLSAAEFAARLSVSPASIQRWESGSGELKLHRRCLAALAALQGKED
jgi:uncharacterized Zn finger protein